MNIKYRIVILEEVFEEINEATLYYDEQQARLGSALLTEWEKALIMIIEIPGLIQGSFDTFSAKEVLK